jgi:hypothetical protein
MPKVMREFFGHQPCGIETGFEEMGRGNHMSPKPTPDPGTTSGSPVIHP